MVVLSKSKAVKAVLASRGKISFTNKIRFDLGKYKESGVGEAVPEELAKNVHLVWTEPRKDKHGPYHALFCISNRE